MRSNCQVTLLVSFERESFVSAHNVKTGFILGQEQDSYMGDFEAGQSFSGFLAQMVFFQRVLDLKEIKQLSSCQ